MNKSKEYVKNTIILLLGKFATQFFSLFLVPLYTHFLLTDDYGLVDLYQTYISLFVPVFLLCMDSAVFRFLVDERNNSERKKVIINSALIKTIYQMFFLVVIIMVACQFINIKYSIFVIINILTIMFSNVLLQICRGTGNNKKYSIVCIIISFVTLITNIVLIVLLKQGAYSILVSSTLGNICGSIFIVCTMKIYKVIDLKKYDKKITKELLKYSIPLIPNALSWWIVNVSDRTIISFAIGVFANGIYAVSCKFSNILNSIFSIFTMSWQETASLHIDEPDRDEFFSNMINDIYQLFVVISLAIILVLAIAFDILIGPEYRTAYNYIPILIFANSFNVLIGLLGGIYIAKKMTKKVTSTTILAAIINIIANLLLIKKVELYAACLSTLVAYFCLSIYRYIDVQKYVKVKLDKKRMVLSFLTFLISFLAYYSQKIVVIVVSILIVAVFSTINNKKIIVSAFNELKIKKAKLKNNT